MKKRARRNGVAVVVGMDPTGAKHTLSSFKGAGASFGAKSHVREIRRRAAHGGDFFTGWKAGYAMLKNRKRGSRRNPWDVTVAWTGKKADYVSPAGNYGVTGHSELAMHTGGAGKTVVRFALWKRPKKGWSGPTDAAQWAQVEYGNGKVLDGTPHEVLPPEVLRIIGRGNYGSPRMPRRKEKLALWALSKGVAANKGKSRNPLTPKETREAVRAARQTMMTGRYTPMPTERGYHLGRAVGMASVAEYYGTGKMRKRASRIRRASGTAAAKTIHRVRKNVGSTHPIWKAGYAVHKFMSTLDGSNLRAWRDVPLAAVIYGGTAAKRAYAASVATVQGRMRDLATTLQSIANLRVYKTLLRTPLRAVAGAFGLMEMLRSDF